MLFSYLGSFHKVIFKIKRSCAFGKVLGKLSAYLFFANTCKAFIDCTCMALLEKITKTSYQNI